MFIWTSTLRCTLKEFTAKWASKEVESNFTVRWLNINYQLFGLRGCQCKVNEQICISTHVDGNLLKIPSIRENKIVTSSNEQDGLKFPLQAVLSKINFKTYEFKKMQKIHAEASCDKSGQSPPFRFLENLKVFKLNTNDYFFDFQNLCLISFCVCAWQTLFRFALSATFFLRWWLPRETLPKSHNKNIWIQFNSASAFRWKFCSSGSSAALLSSSPCSKEGMNPWRTSTCEFSRPFCMSPRLIRLSNS